MQIFTPKLHDPPEKSVQKAFGVKFEKIAVYLKKVPTLVLVWDPAIKFVINPGIGYNIREINWHYAVWKRQKW